LRDPPQAENPASQDSFFINSSQVFWENLLTIE
jgi:hypothetical protein